MRPLLLDLFCGDGGAAAGYHRAGFDVLGVDIVNRPNYPYDFVKADAIDFLADVRSGDFDAIHASPPCQAFSITGNLARAQGKQASGIDLVDVTRDELVRIGRPYIIENVPGAPLHDPLILCGSMFGLKVRRHRLFETSFFTMQPECDHRGQGRPVGVYGSKGDSIPQGGKTAETLDEASEAMGIDWMPWRSLVLAIPPAYTEHIGVNYLHDAVMMDRLTYV